MIREVGRKDNLIIRRDCDLATDPYAIFCNSILTTFGGLVLAQNCRIDTEASMHWLITKTDIYQFFNNREIIAVFNS